MAQLIIIANTTAPARPGRFCGETRTDADGYRTLIVSGHLGSVAASIVAELVYLSAPPDYAAYPLAVFGEEVIER